MHFGGFFTSVGRTVDNILRKRFYVGFENCFTAFPVLFEALRWGFCVNWMNFCQNTGENVSSPALKPIIQHSLFFIEYFGSVFASIGCY